MKSQLLYLVVLTVSLASALFCLQQVVYFFTKKEVVIGSWDQATVQQFSFTTDFQRRSLNSSQVLGTSTKSYTTGTPNIGISTYQGYIFDRYLASHNSPLTGQGDQFVIACKKYGAPSDCTLLLAIAKVETDLCKTDISAKQHNCWGFGGSGPNRILYDNFPQAIDEITRRLMSGYGATFFNNPRRGALSYCGSHCTSWGGHVQSERERINYFAQSQGNLKLF
jgi:hypothetical protein